jgi:hypothetical protein
VTRQLKGGIVYQEKKSIARQQISAATNQHAIIKKVLEAVFSMWPVPHCEDQRGKLVRTRVRDFHTVFNLSYVYDYITKLCRQQAEVIQNHENEYVCSVGEDEARVRKYKRLELGGGQAYDRSSD